MRARWGRQECVPLACVFRSLIEYVNIFLKLTLYSADLLFKILIYNFISFLLYARIFSSYLNNIFFLVKFCFKLLASLIGFYLLTFLKLYLLFFYIFLVLIIAGLLHAIK